MSHSFLYFSTTKNDERIVTFISVSLTFHSATSLPFNNSWIELSRTTLTVHRDIESFNFYTSLDRQQINAVSMSIMGNRFNPKWHRWSRAAIAGKIPCFKVNFLHHSAKRNQSILKKTKQPARIKKATTSFLSLIATGSWSRGKLNFLYILQV